MSGETTSTGPDSAAVGSGAVLGSWKEIAGYLKRSPRTIRRWEHQEGLPVRRHLHGKEATVYAFGNEIDAWLKSRSAAEGQRQSALGQVPEYLQQPAPGADQKTAQAGPILIAILPLRNLSGDPAQERFADGLTEEMVLDVGSCCPGRLRVIASTSVMQYKHSHKSVGEIGRELGVGYILEGGIRRYGRRIRLTARLISARDQANIWADTYEIQLPPIFSLQQSLAQRVAESLAAHLHLTPASSWHRAIPDSVPAQDAYIEGRSFYLPTDEDIKKKLEYFYLAIDREPKFARSYAELALVYSGRLYRDYPPVITLMRIEEHATRALKLDSKLARAHTMMAAAHLFGAWNWAQAETSSGRAITLNPSDPPARFVRAAYYIVVGEPERGMEELEQARRTGPQSPDPLFWLAELAFVARHYDWAIARGQEMLRMHPYPDMVHAALGVFYAQKGAHQLALSHCEKARKLLGASVVATAEVCSAYALAGERVAAARLLDKLVTLQKQKHVRYIALAQAAVTLGNDEQTLDWLEKAYEQRDPILVFLKADPRFDTLSSHPRFRKLVRRIGLPK